MAVKKSTIEWTTYTWNPWVGCRRVSDGCKNCYMYTEQGQRKIDPTEVRRTMSKSFSKPLLVEWDGSPTYIFTCSYSDFFIEQADEWRDEAWAIIKGTPHLTYQILTKRPERIPEHLPADWPYDNVMLGTTVESNRYLKRLYHLNQSRARTCFMSAEPLLGPLPSLPKYLDGGMVDWVIVGGESGPKARTFDFVWARDIIAACQERKIPVFVKQLGSVWAKAVRSSNSKGQNMNDWPQDLRVREMP